MYSRYTYWQSRGRVIGAFKNGSLMASTWKQTLSRVHTHPYSVPAMNRTRAMIKARWLLAPIHVSILQAMVVEKY